MNFKLKATTIAFVTALMAVSLASCGEDPKTVKSVTLSKTTAEVIEGGKLTLTATVNPTTANQNVTWSSSNPEVATVEAGKITALKIGNCTITATSVENVKASASCALQVSGYIGELELTDVQRNKNFIDFEANRAIEEPSEEAFKKKDGNYVIGTDNVYDFRPQLSIYDEEGHKVSDSYWPHDYTIKVEEKVGESYVDKGTDYHTVKDARKGLIQFKTSAEGKTLKVSFTPGGIEESKKAQFTKSEIVDVVNGYNITTADELTLFDNRPQGLYEDYFYSDADFVVEENKIDPKMYEFKQEKGLLGNTSTNFIIHGNLSVTKDNLPSIYFYTEEELRAKGETDEAEIAKVAGSLKDPMYLYVRAETDGNTTVHGNFFKLDFSSISHIVRQFGHKEMEPKVISHSSIFRPRAGTYTFENLNIVGNGARATSEAEIANAGGLIGFKLTNETDLVTCKNIIGKKNYITMYSEVFYDRVGEPPVMVIEDSKLFDNYNSFFYNFGATMTVKNSTVKRSGGPVIIADHSFSRYETTDNDPVSAPNPETGAYTVSGFRSTTKFIDCDLESRVLGTEAWFQDFSATTVSGLIKAMSDIIVMKGVKPSTEQGMVESYAYAVDENGNPIIASQYQGKSAFNFIALGKSETLAGLEDLPTKGVPEISFTTGSKTDEFDFDLDKLIDLTGYGMGYIPFYEFYRGIRAAGAPVFQSAGGWVVAVPSNPEDLTSSSWALYDLVEYGVYVKAAGGLPLPNEVNAASSFYTGMTDNLVLYYQGLMVCMKAQKITFPMPA